MSSKLMNMQVVPNESVVRAQIVQIDPDPNGQGWIWEVAVKSAQDVEGYANFVKAYVGKNIRVYVKKTRQMFVQNDSLEARITYHGDARGGSFTLIQNGIRKLTE